MAVTVGMLRSRSNRSPVKIDFADFGDEVRLVPVLYDDADDVVERWSELTARLDALVFPGPWLHGLVRSRIDTALPCTYVPTTVGMLYAALLRAAASGADVRHVTVDAMDAASAVEAHGELGLVDSTIKVLEYDPRRSPDDYTKFHLENLAEGATLAVTAFDETERALRDAGAPMARLRTTPSVIRAALGEAVALALGSHLEEQQIAVMAIGIPAAGNGVPIGPSNYSYQELRLSVTRILLEETRLGGGVLTTRSDALFVVFLTRGGLDRITANLAVAPFVRRCRAELAIDLAVGVGLGTSAQLAERHALLGLDQVALGSRTGCVLVDSSGERRALDSFAGAERAPVAAAPPEKDMAIFRDLVASLGAARPANGEPWVVDLRTVAEALSVSERTASRICRSLSDAGLAWPVPALRTEHGGRPRHRYQLLVEKLG